MDSPVTIVKSNLTVGKILGGFVVLVAILAICDVAGITNAVLFPVTFAKSKLAKKTS